MNQTNLIYLENPEQTFIECRVIGLQNDLAQIAIELDASPFYPQRGGQRSERGMILSDSSEFFVESVRITSDGRVLHYGGFSKGQFDLMDVVIASINLNERQLHSRIHTAGELICAAIRNMGYEDWEVTSAIHYPEQASIEYTINHFEESEIEPFAILLGKTLDALIQTDFDVQIELLSDMKKVEAVCGYLPDYLPENEPVRIVRVNPYSNIGRPCMGSHCKSLADIGQIEIRYIKLKKGRLKISYCIK